MLNLTRLQQNSTSGLKMGILYGTVVDNNDPDKIQRVKIRVEGLHKNIKDQDLPWSLPIVNTGSAGSAAGIGSVNVPPKGSKVWVMYTDDTMYHSFYLGQVVDKATRMSDVVGAGSDQTGDDAPKDIDQDVANSYPDAIVSKDTSGNRMVVDTKANTIDYWHGSGTRFRVDGKGHLQIEIADHKNYDGAAERQPKGLTLIVNGPVNVNAAESITLTTKADLNFKVEGNMSWDVREYWTVWAKDIAFLVKENPGPMAKAPIPPNDPKYPESGRPVDYNLPDMPSRPRPNIPDPTGKENS